jgi:hypothetical protein
MSLASKSFRMTAAALLLAHGASADITFSVGVTSPTPTRPDGVAAGDFDNDNDIDLVVATDTPDKISFLKNNGNGTFAAPINISTGAGTDPNFVRAVDLDGDTDLDLAVTLHNTGQVLILTNDGSGVFTSAGTFGVGFNPRWITAARMDGNATMDLVVANRDSNSITVLLNAGNLTMTVAAYPVGADPRAVTIADLNRDGTFEVLVTCHGDRSIQVLQNNGAGQLTLGPTLFLGSELRPAGIVASDLDRDGDADIAVATRGTNLNLASIFINNAGVLSGPVNYPTVGVNPGHIGAVDIDRDGDTDVVTVNEDSGSIATLNNNVNG